MHMHSDVLIVGAGPAGLSLAISLAKAGFTTTVLDQNPAATLEQPAPDGREIALGWVGRDGDRADGEQRVWLYFEAQLPDGLEGVRVEHSVLHDRVPRQRNTVRVRQGDRSTTLAFAPGQSPRPIVLAR